MALNSAQQAFIEEYLKNGFNGLQAYLIAYPKAKYDTANANAARLLADPEIQAYIEEKKAIIAERNNVTKGELVNILLSIARNEKNRNSDRINSVLGIAKMCGFITNKVDITSKGSSITLSDMLEFKAPENNLLIEGNSGS